LKRERLADGRSYAAEDGAYTIEATLVLLPFLLAFLSVIMLTGAIAAESKMQYALNQTAKEISRYCYIAGKAKQVAGISSTKDLSKLDGLLSSISDFSSMIRQGEADDGTVTASDVFERIGDVGKNYKSVTATATKLEKSLSAVAEDPSGTISVLCSVLVETAVSDAIGRAAAIALCKTLMPKYLSGSGEKNDADVALEKLGISGGFSAINFGLSSIMTDGKSIDLVAVYDISLFGSGLFSIDMNIRQTASTSAWLPEAADGDPDEDDGSVWRLDNFSRGRFFVNEIKSENKSDAVKGGMGFDLYDVATSVYTSVISLNPFGTGYTDYSPPEDGETVTAENYKIKEKALSKAIKENAVKLKKSFSALKKGDLLEREYRGRYGNTIEPDLKGAHLKLILIFPSEAEAFTPEIDRITNTLEKSTGVNIEAEYRYSALTGKTSGNDKTNGD